MTGKRPPRRPARKAAKAAPRPRRHRWVLVLGGLLLLWPLGRIAIRIAAEREIERALGFDASVGAVDLEEGGARVAVHDVRLRHPARYGPFVAADRIEVPFSRPVWRDGGGTIGEVRIEGLAITLFPGDLEGLRRDGGGPTSPDGGPSPGSPSPAPSDETPPPSRGPSAILVERARVTLVMPREDGPALRLEARDLSLRLAPDGRGGWTIARGAGSFLGGKLVLDGFRRSDASWALQARLADARLEVHEAAAALGASGRLNGALRLASGGAGPTGAGWLDLDRGEVWELPVLSDVAAAAGLALGGGELVRRARAEFHLEHGRLRVEELHLRGTPLSLWGRGEAGLDGRDLDLRFVPRLVEGLTGDLPLVGEPTQLLLDLVGGGALEIRLRGRLDDPRVETAPLPFLSDPVRDFLGGEDDR
ncbi:MAG: hypothetical protein R3F20_10825 [Planctomycetota bacterium]